MLEEDNSRPLLSNSSEETVEEQLWEGRESGSPNDLDGETHNLAFCDEEILNRGPGVMIPFRLGDLDMLLPLTDPGSGKGRNRDVHFICCITLRCSKIVLMVGLSDGSV